MLLFSRREFSSDFNVIVGDGTRKILTEIVIGRQIEDIPVNLALSEIWVSQRLCVDPIRLRHDHNESENTVSAAVVV